MNRPSPLLLSALLLAALLPSSASAVHKCVPQTLLCGESRKSSSPTSTVPAAMSDRTVAVWSVENWLKLFRRNEARCIPVSRVTEQRRRTSF